MTREEVDGMSLAVVAAALVIGPLIVIALGPWLEMRAYNRHAQEQKATYWQAVRGDCDHTTAAAGSVKDWAAVQWER